MPIADASSNLALAQEVAERYWRAGRVLGVPTDLNLGQSVQAETSLQKADRLIELVLASQPRNRRALVISEQIAESRMILADSDHRSTDALQYARKSGGASGRFPPAGPT